MCRGLTGSDDPLAAKIGECVNARGLARDDSIQPFTNRQQHPDIRIVGRNQQHLGFGVGAGMRAAARDIANTPLDNLDTGTLRTRPSNKYRSSLNRRHVDGDGEWIVRAKGNEPPHGLILAAARNAQR
jgi:hypothetical protein